MVFNREFQRRAARQVLDRIGLTAAQDDSGFYRPAIRPRPGANSKRLLKTRKGKAFVSAQLEQLELFTYHFPPSNEGTKQEVKPDPDRPLLDLFPEAYQS